MSTDERKVLEIGLRIGPRSPRPAETRRSENLDAEIQQVRSAYSGHLLGVRLLGVRLLCVRLLCVRLLCTDRHRRPSTRTGLHGTSAAVRGVTP